MHNKRIKILLTTLYVFLVLIIFMTMLDIFNSRGKTVNSVDISAGWQMNLPEGDYRDVNVGSFAFKALQRGEEMVMENLLPNYDFNAPQLRIWLCHSAFDVFVDDELIYTYGKEKLINHQMINNGYHWINLPRDAQGKRIVIHVYVNEPNAFSNIDKMYIMDASDATGDLISENLLPLCTGLFLCLFGICIILMAIFVREISHEFMPLIDTGVFAIIIGLWTLTNKGLLQIVSVNRDITMVCEYFGLFLGPLPILLFFYHLRKQEKARILKTPILVMIWVNIVMVLVTVILHVTEKVHYPALLQYYHVFDGILVVYVISTSLYNFISKRKNDENAVLVGIFLLALCFSFDIAIFNLGKYINGIFNHLIGATSLGGIVFVVCMLFSVGNYVLTGITSKIETEALMKLVYTDSLTGLYNRTKINDVSDHINSGEKSEFTLVNFDLNGLKTINDTKGHSMGDKLLKSFANVLSDTFTKNSIICRVGGDEFNILIFGCDRTTVENYFEKLEKRIDEENAKNLGYTVSAAWGVAYSDEIEENDFHAVSKLADKRMYARKKEMKKTGNL